MELHCNRREHDNDGRIHHVNDHDEMHALAGVMSNDFRDSNVGGYANPKNERGEMTVPG